MTRNSARIPRRWRQGDALSHQRLNELRDYAVGARPGVEPPRQRPTSGAQRGIRVQRFRIKEILADALVCRTWDGTQEGDIDTYVARTPLLRGSQASRTVDGQAITYAYTNETFTTRTATRVSDSAQETQVIVPSYEVDDEIYASRNLVGGTGVVLALAGEEVTVNWLDENRDGRVWAEQ